MRRDKYFGDLITEWRGLSRGNDLLTELEIDQLIHQDFTPDPPKKKLSKKHRRIIEEIERSLTQ